MSETYVKLKTSSDELGTDVFCPIKLATHEIVIGLTIIGSIPDDGAVIGEFDEETNTIKLYDKKVK